MPYDPELARRMDVALQGLPGLQSKKMFGGIGYLINGNMACGVLGEDLIIRVGPGKYDEALAQPFTRPFAMTGRPMSGWVLVNRSGVIEASDFKNWIDQAVEYAQSLPAK
jgi:TfoX/Sxy family transcriptional regulator of competence genes